MNRLDEFLKFPPRFATPDELERHEREVRESVEYEEKLRRRDAWTEVEATIPALHRDAKLDAPWLRALVGLRVIRPAESMCHELKLVFIGPTGAGKSSLAVAMLRARHDLYSRFVNCLRLGTARIQHQAGDGEALYVESAMRAPFALLDELGGERHTQNNATADVIFERHARALPTWFTTGLDEGELAARYGGGAARRVFEGATVIRLGSSK